LHPHFKHHHSIYPMSRNMIMKKKTNITMSMDN
jgi:hypothetical protein